jgi:hypothetical protein
MISPLLHADHPIAGHRLTVKQFLALEHAVVRAPGRSQEIFERFLERKRLRPRIALSTLSGATDGQRMN